MKTRFTPRSLPQKLRRLRRSVPTTPENAKAIEQLEAEVRELNQSVDRLTGQYHELITIVRTGPVKGDRAQTSRKVAKRRAS